MDVVYHLTARILERQHSPESLIELIKPGLVYNKDILRRFTPIEIVALLSCVSAYNQLEDRSCLIVIDLIREIRNAAYTEQPVDSLCPNGSAEGANPTSLHTDSDFVALKQTYDRLYDEYTALKATTASLQAKACDMGTHDSCNLAQRCADAEQINHERANEIDNLKECLMELKHDYDRLEATALSLEQRLSDLQRDRDQMMETNDVTEQEKYEYQNTVNKQKTELEYAKVVIADLRAKLASSESTTSDNQIYKQLYETQGKLLAQISAELREATAERDRLGASVSSITSKEVAELTDIIARHEATITSLQDVIREKNEFIESQCNQYVVQLTTTDHQITLLNQDLENALNENVVLSAEIEELRRRLGFIHRGVSPM